MLFYSQKSGRKIVHSSECYQIKRVKDEDVGVFHTVDDAWKHGYRMCQCCGKLSKSYRQEKKKVDEYCSLHPTTVRFKNDYLTVTTPWSSWRIVSNRDNSGIALFHKNTRVIALKSSCPITGYHLQPKTKTSVVEYLEYIVSHDLMMNLKESAHMKKKPEVIGTLGNKKNKRKQKAMKKREKKRSITRVMNLIDSFRDNRINKEGARYSPVAGVM